MVSLLANDLVLVVTASSEYDRATHILSPSWRVEEFTCRSPERQEVLERRSSLKDMVLSLLRELGAPVLSVEVRYDRDLGLYILAVLDCDARQALEYWLRIADLVSALRIPVFIAWLGHTDVEPEEMGSYLGRILARMSVFPATREPIDIARILREEWGI